MPSSILFYQDQLLAGGTSEPAAGCDRIVYCRFGKVKLNGETLAADDACYVGEDMVIEGVADWSQIWRWEVDLPDAEQTLLSGRGVLTHHCMSRVITMHTMEPGTEWIFCQDQINAPLGRVTDPHKHPGPGIRCMVEGTFNVQQDVESVREVVPGHPWRECGEQPAITWGSKTMHARFLRGIVMPAENAGQTDTIKSKAGAPNKKKGNFKPLVDQIITANGNGT